MPLNSVKGTKKSKEQEVVEISVKVSVSDVKKVFKKKKSEKNAKLM